MAGVIRNFLLRVENWLLIIPVILLIVEEIFFSPHVYDLHLHDTYFVIASFYIGIGILAILIIPYLCHILLRLQKKRNRVVLNTHIIATILLLLFLFIAVKQYEAQPRRYYDFSTWESYQQFGGLDYYSGIAVLAFTGTQLLFILYTIVRLVMKKRAYQ